MHTTDLLLLAFIILCVNSVPSVQAVVRTKTLNMLHSKVFSLQPQWTQQYNSLSKCARTTALRMMPLPKKTMMVPSITALASSFDSSVGIGKFDKDFLNQIPKELSTTYRPVPLRTKAGILFGSVFVSSLAYIYNHRPYLNIIKMQPIQWKLQRLTVLFIRVCLFKVNMCSISYFSSNMITLYRVLYWE